MAPAANAKIGDGMGPPMHPLAAIDLPPSKRVKPNNYAAPPPPRVLPPPGRTTYRSTTSSNAPKPLEQNPYSTSRGLRHFSMKVCEKVEEKGTTTYNEVADEVSRYLMVLLWSYALLM